MKRLLHSYAVAFAVAAAASILAACDDDDPAMPTTGAVAGTVTFQGTWPTTGMVIVGLYASLPPMGAPDAYTDPIPAGTSYQFSLTGIDPATYDGIVVGWIDPALPPGSEETLGFYWAYEDSVAVDSNGVPRGLPLPITVVAGETKGSLNMVANLDVAP